jgi:putative transposase
MSTILRAYKTELDPTWKQVRLLLQHAGAARWAFNWGLHKKIEAYKETGKSPSAIDLHRELNLLKKLPIEEGGIPWMYESSKCAPQEKLRDLDKAYKNFFRRCKEGAKQKGFPRFKSRKKGIGSFRLTGSVRPSATCVQLPVIGEVKLKEHGYFPTKGIKILSATISEVAGRWYVSLQVEKEHQPHKYPFEHVVGVDVGIKHLAITSDGEVFENPHALVGLQSILRVRQKAVSRKKKGSHNRRKAVHRLAVLHARIANIRKDAIHKMTRSIAKSASVVVIESLNVVGMLKNHCLARSLSDASLGEIHRQLGYKMRWSGGEVLEADRFYPSSKRCSKCGHVKAELSLSERTYHCENPECGHVIDRDLNAALNLKLWPQVRAVAACCPGSSGRNRKTSTKLLVGQETRRENQAYV